MIISRYIFLPLKFLKKSILFLRVFNLIIKKNKKNYREYPKDTLIGWRVPMLLWKDVIDDDIMIHK